MIIPLTAEFFALRAVALLMETIDKVKDRLNQVLEVDGVVATMYDARTLHSREVMSRLEEAFGDKLFETVIKRTIKFADANVAAEPITTYAGNHPWGRGVPQPGQGTDLPRWRPVMSAQAVEKTAADSSADETGGGFRLALENFNGPFDVLLHLITQREMDITEVALAEVTDEFIAYLEGTARHRGWAEAA